MRDYLKQCVQVWWQCTVGGFVVMVIVMLPLVLFTILVGCAPEKSVALAPDTVKVTLVPPPDTVVVTDTLVTPPDTVVVTDTVRAPRPCWPPRAPWCR